MAFMKKILKLLLCSAVLCMLFAAPASAAAQPTEYFTISDYTVNVEISDNNTYDVSEIIKVQFTEPRHGIYRDIPFKGTWVRDKAHGGSTNYTATVSDIAVQGYNYSVSHVDNNVEIKIGDADTTVSGEQTYRISYRIQYGDDGASDFDEVYYNIIGNQWDTTIDHVTFSVALPKAFDPSTIGFSTGYTGAAGYDAKDLKFIVNGNTITGELTRKLSSYEALTMRVQLPQGYFQLPNLAVTDWLVVTLIGALVLVGLLLFFLFGRDDKPVKTVEFYAPEGMSPSEVGYIIDGCVDNRDVVSLVIYWAHRGYLTIEDTGGSTFKFTKIKDLHGDAKPFERHMFDKLFKLGPTVTSSDLKYTFYKTIESTKSMVSDSFEREDSRVFTKISTGLKPLTSFLAALPVMITLALTNYRDTQDMMSTLITTAIVGILILLPVFFIIGIMRSWRGQRPAIRVIKLISALVLSFIAVAFFIGLTYEKVYVPALPLFAALATIILGIIAVFIIKRTPKGVEWLGKILGFQEFLNLAERPKLIELVEQDPKYFYNILPYAWVLNVSDKWAKKFETIALQPPDWYYGHTGAFYPMMFVSDLNHSMNSVQTMMSSRPSSSGSGGGGGGCSGGGFSGGGGGGGGGGSW
jgi:uncharacterized membrane protein YgcG